MIDLNPSERAALERLTGDAELTEVLRKIDEYEMERLARALIDETQAAQPETPKMIQLGSQISERKRGVSLYLRTMKELREINRG